MAEAIFSNLGAFLMAIIMTFIPSFNISLPGLKAKEEGCNLNLAMFSDVHIEKNELFRQAFLKTALKKGEKSDDVDAFVMAGDITNYADEASLAKYYELITDCTDKPVVTAAGNHDIGHVGDRDKTDITKYEALANVIKYQTAYKEAKSLKNYKTEGSNYYSCEINGYKFIVMGDEVDGFTVDNDGKETAQINGHWDGITMTHKQIDFIDRELAEGTKENKPCFIVSHWPICGTDSEDTVWPGSGIDQNEYDLVSVMEKYKNVVYISGHMHSGVKSKLVEKAFGITSAEKKAFTQGGNEVIYFSLPTLGIINVFGLLHSGTGATLEVYDDHIIWRPINYITGNWYENAEYTFSLSAAKK